MTTKIESDKFSPMSMTSPKRWLFHFTRLETALEKILFTETIRMNPVKNVNDPKESKLDAINLQGLGFQREQMAIVDRVRQRLTACVKIICTTENQCTADQLAEFEEVQACYKPTMWAHYGESYRGICLVFDRQLLQDTVANHLAERDLQVLTGSVEYAPDRSLFDPKRYGLTVDEIEASGSNADELARKRFSHAYRNLFLLKHEDWEPEQEWRLITFDSTEGPIDVPFGDALAGIVVGTNFPSAYRETVRHFAWRNGASAHSINWSVSGWGASDIMGIPLPYTPTLAQRLDVATRDNDEEEIQKVIQELAENTDTDPSI